MVYTSDVCIMFPYIDGKLFGTRCLYDLWCVICMDFHVFVLHVYKNLGISSCLIAWLKDTENIIYPHHYQPPPRWPGSSSAQDRYENLADKGLSLQLGGKETRQRLDHRSLGFPSHGTWWVRGWPPGFHDFILLEARFQNSSRLKIYGWNTSFLLAVRPIFEGKLLA